MVVHIKILEERNDGIKFFKIENEIIKIILVNVGCRIMEIHVPDRNGNKSDVILGIKNIEDYKSDPAYMGAVLGRVANRVGNAEFKLNGKTYKLNANSGKNTLHGGNIGFDKKIFQEEILDNGIRFFCFSPDGEEGYPGNMNLMVEYTLENNEFCIRYTARSDADTIANFTNHMYFNLSDRISSIKNHYLQIDADKVGCIDENCLATGKIISVAHTPFDFRKKKQIGKDIHMDDIQLKNAKGYDHPFILNGTHEQVCLENDDTGRRLTISTTAPTVQVYTGNYLSKACIGKHGKVYENRAGVALETQFMPNSINIEKVPTMILRAGEVLEMKTVYRFDTI